MFSAQKGKRLHLSPRFPLPCTLPFVRRKGPGRPRLARREGEKEEDGVLPSLHPRGCTGCCACLRAAEESQATPPWRRCLRAAGHTPVIDCCGFAGLSALSNQEEGTRHIHTLPSSVPVASMPVSWHITDVVTIILGISDHSATPIEQSFDMAAVPGASFAKCPSLPSPLSDC